MYTICIVNLYCKCLLEMIFFLIFQVHFAEGSPTGDSVESMDDKNNGKLK